MEITSTSSSYLWNTNQTKTSTSSSLTEDQKTTLNSLLEGYDLENMDAENMESLFEAMKESGIPMNSETESILSEAGLEKPEDMPPPPDGGAPVDEVAADSNSDTEEIEADEELLDLIEQYQNGTITEEEFLQQAASYGATGSAGSIVNKYA
ncbi:MAG: hypothetical protein JW739_00605 [Opitutales bacterium]|nr:hypothetical protein [Opitutales bacterium]